jgi:hypothetical protein
MTATPRKISEMPPATVIADADLLPIVDVSESSVSSKNKKVTIAQILASLPDGAITSAKIADGAIVDADVNAAAAIADTKLATIATAGKVSNSATTATNANTAIAIVARDGSGNFSAGTITAALAGNASTVTTNANLTGDVTSVGNATSIAAGVVVDADVSASAGIAYGKLALTGSLVNADVNASAGIVASKLSFTQAGTGAVARTVDSRLKEVVSVKDFGAVGNFNGTTGANDTDEINAALQWWAGGEGRHLHFPEGWYYYAGVTNIDLGSKKFNKITCDGQITFGGTAGTINWTISNLENGYFQLNLRNGGLLGDFTNSTPVGGTTALKFHTIRWGHFDIESMNYRGRVVHFTAGGTDQSLRCQMLDLNIRTGNRTESDDDALCGQPFFADSANCDQTGAFGKVSWRGEGCAYGPVFERLNDIDIGHIEAGKFSVKPMEFRGCVVVMINVLYIGATDSTAGANADGVRFVTSAAGRLNGDVHIKTLRILRSVNGLYATGFDSAQPGIRIDSFTCDRCATALVFNGVPTAVVDAAGGEGMVSLLDVQGSCGNIYVNVDKVYNVTGDVIKVSGTVNRLKISGLIEVGAGAGFSLVNLGTENNKVDLIDLDLVSSTCDQLVKMDFGGENKVRLIGGSMTGTSAKFNTPRAPEFAVGVRGYQTESCGGAIVLSGQSAVTFDHGLARPPQHVSLTGLSAELSQPYITSITSTQITAAVPAPVTANRQLYWNATASIAREDLDA